MERELVYMKLRKEKGTCLYRIAKEKGNLFVWNWEWENQFDEIGNRKGNQFDEIGNRKGNQFDGIESVHMELGAGKRICLYEIRNEKENLCILFKNRKENLFI